MNVFAFINMLAKVFIPGYALTILPPEFVLQFLLDGQSSGVTEIWSSEDFIGNAVMLHGYIEWQQTMPFC